MKLRFLMAVNDNDPLEMGFIQFDKDEMPTRDELDLAVIDFFDSLRTELREAFSEGESG